MTEKLHAACDECRTRKLKCSGETPACGRCGREKIKCVYSPQKPMGRPKKRRREEAAPEHASESSSDLPTNSDNFLVPPFNESGLISPPELDYFSELAEFQSNDVMPNPMVLSLHTDPAVVNGYAQGLTSNLPFGVDSIDPSLWGAQPNVHSGVTTMPNQPDTGTCTCLSIMYLTLSDLQAMKSFVFPAVIPSLREAMHTASSIIHCEECPKECFTAMQNLQSLNALLAALAERFHKVLTQIDVEAARLAESGQKQSFRVGDNRPENMHLHTGTSDCPMGFNIELEAKDWKRLAKLALRTEVLGGGSNQKPLVWLLDEWEKRQKRWHSDRGMLFEERSRIWGAENVCTSVDDAECLRSVRQLRKMIDNMSWE